MKKFEKYRRALLVVGRVLTIIISLSLVIVLKMVDSIDDTDFDFKRELVKSLTQPLTYFTSLAISLLWNMIYVVVYSVSKERKLATQDSLEIFSEYKTMYKLKPRNFRDYLKVENLKRKKVAYIDKMETKLEKVQTKMEKIPIEKHDSKKYQILKVKEEDIIKKLNEKYVAENLTKLSCKYNRVSIDDFKLDRYTNAKITDKTSSSEKKMLSAILLRKTISGVLSSSAIILTAISFSMKFNLKDASFWITLISVIILSFLQVYFASETADRLTDSEILAPTRVKAEIIKESLQWENVVKQDNDITIAFNKLIEEEKIKREVVKEKITISKEELEYLKLHREQIQEEINTEKGDENNNGGQQFA